MTNTRRVRSQLAAIGRMAANLNRDAPGALRAIELRTTCADGYPSTASGADTGPMGTAGSSSVERAVERRLGASERNPGPITDLENAEDFLRAGALALDNVNRILMKYIDGLSDAERRALRCIGDGTAEGAVCFNWSTRKGMCDKCRKRVERRERVG